MRLPVAGKIMLIEIGGVSCFYYCVPETGNAALQKLFPQGSYIITHRNCQVVRYIIIPVLKALP